MVAQFSAARGRSEGASVNFGVVEMMVLLAAVAGSGTMAWLLMWLHGRLKRLETGGGQDTERLALQIDAVREQLGATRDEVMELYERLEFAERLLVRGKDASSREPRQIP